MANFEIAYQITAAHEGGYQRHPNDTGNYNSEGDLVGTNWGINAKVYEAHLGEPPSTFDMQSMSRLTAKAIYLSKYWNSIKGSQIQNQYIANILYDGRVNHGYTGVKMIQEVLGLAKDGIVGNMTLSAINSADPKQLYNAYKQKRIDFYNWLAENREGHSVFLKGWLKRINKFNDYRGVSSSGGSKNKSIIAGIVFAAITGLIIRN